MQIHRTKNTPRLKIDSRNSREQSSMHQINKTNDAKSKMNKTQKTHIRWKKRREQRVFTSRRGSRSSTEEGGSMSLFPASRSCSSSSLSAESIGVVFWVSSIVDLARSHTIETLETLQSKKIQQSSKLNAGFLKQQIRVFSSPFSSSFFFFRFWNRETEQAHTSARERERVKLVLGEIFGTEMKNKT